MTPIRFALALGIAAIAGPALAQTQPAQDPASAGTPLPEDRGYDKDSARTRAINESGRPAVDAANQEVLAQAALNGGAEGAVNAADAARYAQDMAHYRAALRARRHVVARDEARYDRQQRAYADAMADWRLQVIACKRGNSRACNAPTPNPAAFY